MISAYIKPCCSIISTLLVQRRNKNVAAVVLANKNARIVWALLTSDTRYRAEVVATASA